MIRKALLVLLITSQLWAKPIHSKETLYPSYKGLIMAGYQGWFGASRDGTMYPDASRIRIDMWPDVSEYTQTYPTGLKHADGSTAYFFQSRDQSTIDIHFKWMERPQVILAGTLGWEGKRHRPTHWMLTERR